MLFKGRHFLNDVPLLFVYGAVSLNSVIAVLDADFHSLPSTQHRQQYGPVSFSGHNKILMYFVFMLIFLMKM